MVILQNCPFTPALSQGINQLRQTGALDMVVRRWEGQIPGLEAKEREVLKGGQLLLIFVVLTFTMAASLFIFGCEQAYFHFVNGRRWTELRLLSPL